MSEKIITVKSGSIVTKEDGKEWIELIDQDDKVQRVFPSMLKTDGTWVHLEKEIDELKALIEAGEIGGKTYKLTKEKKGTFYNVIAIESVKSILIQQAQKQVEDKDTQIKQRSILLSYCKDLAVADKIKVEGIIPLADKFYAWMAMIPQIETPTATKDVIPDDLKEAVTQLKAKNLQGLNEIVIKYGLVKGEKVSVLWQRLTAEQRAGFTADINHALIDAEL